MKEKMFRKAICVLLLLLIAMAGVPAAKAYAKEYPELMKSTVYLMAGTEKQGKYQFEVRGMNPEWTLFWYSSDEKVATVDAESGEVTAIGVGKAVISVVISGMKDEFVDELSANVIVKDNIKTLEITNTPENDKLPVGTEHDFNRSYVTQANQTSNTTSVTRWLVDKTTASITDSGRFIATEPGTYTITALAFQSKAKYQEWLVLKDTTSRKNVLITDEYTFIVVDNRIGVKQVNSTMAKLSFPEAMSEDDIQANLAVSMQIANGKDKQLIRKVTMSEDGRTAIVDMIAGFQSEKTYVFEYPGMVSCQFVGATANISDVADITINTDSFIVNKASTIDVTLVNKDGIDIGSINKSLLSRITVSAVSPNYVTVNSNVLPNQVTMYNIGDKADITVEFHTYDYDKTTGREKGNLIKTKTITAIATPPNPASSIAAWTLGKSASEVNFAAVNHGITAEDGAVYLYISALKQDGENYVSNLWALGNEGWKYTSSDPSILDVYMNGNQTAVLFPSKVGLANVLVYYTEDKYTANPEYKFVGSIPVTVTPKRVPTTLSLSDYNITLSNSSLYVDSKAVTITVLDQYGASMPLYGVDLVELPNSMNGVDPINTELVVDTGSTITFYGASTYGGVSTTVGTYTYKVSANGLQNTITVNVIAPESGSDPLYYKLQTAAFYDQKITYVTQLPLIATVKLLGYSTNGVPCATLNSATAASKGYQIMLYRPDGTIAELNTSATQPDIYGSYEITSVSGSYVVKADKGVYVLKLFKGSQLIDTVSFTVADTQPTPYFVINKSSAEYSNTVEAAVKECFTIIDSNGIPVTDLSRIRIEPSDYYGLNTSGSTVFIKNIRYDELIVGYNVTHILNINKSIILK